MSGFRANADRWLKGCIEALVLVLTCASPWAFGAVEPIHEYVLDAGVAVLLLLWAGRMLVQQQFIWKKCPVLLCLGALFLLGIVQLQPVPRFVLGVLSPSALQISDEMLPQTPEVLPAGESYARPPLAAGRTLSLYPHATLRELFRLLAVFVVFAVVRNNVASPESLRRLCIMLVINGSLLAFFAMLQFFSSPRDTVYWIYKTQGSVFGPFVCRTHYPFYVNVCIGAGLGLLLQPAARDRGVAEAQGGQATLLQDAPRLFLCCALALMVSSVTLSLARGGILALLAGGAIVLLIAPPRGMKLARVTPLVLTVVFATALVAWLGWPLVEARIATIWEGEALMQSRLPLWADSWPLVAEFPLLGTGYGTFMYVEPLHRARTLSIFIHEHAHNEFLEAMIEGGIVRLTISLVAIGLVFWYGIRAYRRNQGKAPGSLALGALFGFSTIVFHSIGDFGLHLPAIAFLATVLCAHLVAAGSAEPLPSAKESDPSRGAYVFRWLGVAPVMGALVAVTLALLLWSDGRRLAYVQAFHREAAVLQGDMDDRTRELAVREAAAYLAPGSARELTDLGDVHMVCYEARHKELASGAQAFDYSEMILHGFSPLSLACQLQKLNRPNGSLAEITWNSATAEDLRQLSKKHLAPGLRAYLQARDVCPLLAKPQIRIAAYCAFLTRADQRTVYVDRAKRVVTNDPELWFLFGMEELVDGQRDRAARSWCRSLELSESYLTTILQVGKEALGPQALAHEVLPDRPEILLKSAEWLYPKPEQTEERRPLLKRALTALRQQEGPLNADDIYLKARIYASLGQPGDAVAAYRQALDQQPLQPDWRYELALLLISEKRLPEARQDLQMVLNQKPTFDLARDLLTSVEREMKKNR